MKITLVSSDDETSALVDVDSDLTVGELKRICHGEYEMPGTYYSHIHTRDCLKKDRIALKSFGIRNGDVIYLSKTRGNHERLPEEIMNAADIQLHKRLLHEADDNELKFLLLSDMKFIERLKKENIGLLRNILDHRCDIGELRAMVLKYLHSKEKELAKFGTVEDRRVAMSSCNSRMNNIRNNMCKAMTSIPGSFTFQGMLVLDCKLNGRQVYGLVDTGAQASLLSEKCAIRCGLADLIDRQWEGKAKGLEEQRICGRIHMVDLIVGETKLPTSFAVLPTQAMDVIIGIDTLKIYQCAIDLDKGILRIGKKKTSIKFLKEEELPVELGKREARCLKCRKSYQQLTSPFQFRSAEKNQLNHQRKEVRCPEMS